MKKKDKLETIGKIIGTIIASIGIALMLYLAIMFAIARIIYDDDAMFYYGLTLAAVGGFSFVSIMCSSLIISIWHKGDKSDEKDNSE